ncbi:2,3-bisphosphoglycerate-independent phosphoglycerate mutase [Rubripirellula amarantea]|uniref:2,3-bisphosphoglycerate-independent phosphoglycerate mutase n=1 Tax=Rubripirellula amarantea TaxID=2527999 RepID=A0A5C5WQ79_9BACT|nr:2,3-bisphosphoglycerate-independent phosphoglycerate mutase [Rubripirellula amarantea]MDA8745089.1 2,3-bisphosphoglycerate-independent phosphoglycerate mutase [Rubripirellula amarantea]TWT52936.1 2,3-bisphosphoglycerate-independent phosphoglycerate mutase [Rubripirellula amarantea]
MQVRRKPVVLIIRDGWGENPNRDADATNAIVQANTPVSDKLMSDYPNTLVKTSGEDVGLPAGVMGNSEVGHQNIGAGRIVDQEVMRITRAIRSGAFFTNPTITAAVEHVKSTGGTLHLLGLMSDGRVHSDIEHAYAFIQVAKDAGLGRDGLAIHAITDGRDTSPTSGVKFVRSVEEKCKEIGAGHVASVIGRYFAMDRDFRWDRVQQAYDLLTKGSDRTANSAAEAVQNYYDNPTTASVTGDEFVAATTIERSLVKDGDAVIFMNYRGDRPRELTKAFVYDDAAWASIEGGGFDRGKKIDNLYFATMAGYETGLPVHVIFEKPAKMPHILGEYVSSLGLHQFRCAETEKYPHVTFFFNDYRDEPFNEEDRGMAQSPRDVSTYDQKPEMSAEEVADKVLNEIDKGEADLIVVNFANGDMVGHTGVLAAAVSAVETVDACVGKVVDATLAKGGSLIVTADHGNCEQMIDPETGGPHTAHTTFDVPLIVVEPGLEGKTLRSGGRLADIAPTVLALMGLPKPEEMTGESLVEV